MASDGINGSPSVRVIIQQCLSAELQVQPPSDGVEAQSVEISRGIVIYVCFLKGSTLELVQKVVKSILNIKLSESVDKPGNVSILDLPGDVLIVPQATLGGKMKGKSVQYHSNIAKDEGRIFYERFIALCEDEVHSTSAKKTVKHGRLLIFLLLQPFEGHGKYVAFKGTQFTQVYQPYHLLPF